MIALTEDDVKVGHALSELAIGACALAMLPATASGAAILNPMFQDHAVLQRGMPIPVYGDASPGSVISVKLDAVALATKADEKGHWQVVFPAMAGENTAHRLEASADHGASDVAADVLIGDVFLCGGQSNMAFEVSAANNARAEIASSQDDAIRSLTIRQKSSDTVLDRFADPVHWVSAGPDTTGAFSASCYFFARDLRRKTHLPVGIVAAAWGGSRVRAWVSASGLSDAKMETQDLGLLALRHTQPAAADGGWNAKWEDWWRARHGHGTAPWSPSFDAGGWKVAPASLGAWALWEGASPDGFVGQMWMRTEVTLTAEQAKQDAILDLGSVTEEDESWINGRGVGGTAGQPSARHAIPGGVLHAGVNTIVTNIFCSWRNCGLSGPAGARAVRLADGTTVPLSQSWRYAPMQPDEIAPQLPWGPIHGVSVIYNGMIAPIGPYAFKAAIWYQGESDVHFAPLYQRTLGTMMADWRRQFRSDLPFVIVQLPDFGPHPVRPAESEIADIREAQRRAAVADPRSDYVVTIDIGDPDNIHPTNKQEVGRRLSATVGRMLFAETSPAGPRPVSATLGDGAVTVRFAGVSGEIVSFSGAPTAFETCTGAAGGCHYATARIAGRDEVRLDTGATRPARVRYCWGDSPVCNLSDNSGLPTGPFEIPVHAAAAGQ